MTRTLTTLVLFFTLLASALPVPVLAVIEDPGNSTDAAAQQKRDCQVNNDCLNVAGVNGVCSDVHYAGDDVTLKKCSRCTTAGAAQCTSGLLCNSDASLGAVGACIGPSTEPANMNANTLYPGGTTCSTNADCGQGTCNVIQFQDRRVKMCAGCQLPGAVACTGGATACTASTGLCEGQSAQAQNPGYGSCDDDAYCQEHRGENYRCMPVSQGSTQKTCVLAPDPADVAGALGGGQPCTVGGDDCPGNVACVPVGEETGTGGAGFCATGMNYQGDGLVNALQADTFEELVTDILDAVVQLGAIFLVLALVWTGFLFVQAQGSEDKIKKAREALFWSVAGGLILLGASAISLAIKGFVGAL